MMLKKFMKATLYALMAVLGFVIWFYFAQKDQLTYGFLTGPEKSIFSNKIVLIIYGYLVTVIGVVLGTIYRELSEMKEKGRRRITKIGVFIKRIFSSIDLWLGLLGSPFVYALIWKSIDEGSISGLTVIALQNGFSCTIITNSFLKKSSTD
jgi:hypothetical protein